MKSWRKFATEMGWGNKLGKGALEQWWRRNVSDLEVGWRQERNWDTLVEESRLR